MSVSTFPSPNPTKPVTILEEGMAEVFAYIYMQDTWKGELPSKTPGSAYHVGTLSVPCHLLRIGG
ncbi:MAG: hypothetical protein MN733_10055 [Nitrososphaera sp.]|nr:hypothetical protein [Nitrososphaera sp.]